MSAGGGGMPGDDDYGERSRQDWSMSQERQMVEKIINHRFNFFMVIFTVVITSSVSAESGLHLRVILAGGLLICAMFSYSLWLNQERLNFILKLLAEDSGHPIAILARLTGRPVRRWVIGYAVPGFCLLFLAAMNVMAWVLPLPLHR